jgi:hypothetical protein
MRPNHMRPMSHETARNSSSFLLQCWPLDDAVEALSVSPYSKDVMPSAAGIGLERMDAFQRAAR